MESGAEQTQQPEELTSYKDLQEIVEKFPWIKDPLTDLKKHNREMYEASERVAVIARRLGRALEYSEEQLDVLTCAAFVHDIGKVEVPNELLNKRGLSDEEWETMRSHVRIGFELALPHRPGIAKRLVGHHEHQGERSYPRRQPREDDDPEITRDQKIIAVSDVADASMSNRPDRQGISKEEAYALLSNQFADDAMISKELLQLAVETRSQLGR